MRIRRRMEWNGVFVCICMCVHVCERSQFFTKFGMNMNGGDVH